MDTRLSEYDIIAYTDGAARGINGKGPSSCAFVAYRDGVEVKRRARSLGTHTNNFAEYTALIEFLDWLLTTEYRSVIIRSDSELMVRQLNGIYRVKHPDIIPLYMAALTRLTQLRSYKVEHVRAHQKDSDKGNVEADALCNLVLDSNLAFYELG